MEAYEAPMESLDWFHERKRNRVMEEIDNIAF